MLNDISDGKTSLLTKIVLGTIFILMLASLVIMDVKGVMSGAGGNPVLATVDGQRITQMDVNKEIVRLIQDYNLKLEEIKRPEMASYALQKLIGEKINIHNAEKLNIVFSDKYVAQELKAILANPTDSDGQQSLAEKYRIAQRQSGRSEKEYDTSVRLSIAQRVLREALAAEKLPEPLFDNVVATRALEKRDIAIITIPLSAANLAPDDAGKAWMQKYYKDNQNRFATPEQRTGRVFILSGAALDKQGGEDVQSYVMEIEDAFAGSDDIAATLARYSLTERAATAKELTDLGPDASEGVIGNATALDNGDYAFVVADKITPSKIKDFKEVEPEILAAWQQQTAFENAKKVAVELRAAKDPLALAREKKLDVTVKKDVATKDIPPALFAMRAVNQIDEITTDQDNDIKLGTVTAIRTTPRPWVSRKATQADYEALAQVAKDSLLSEALLVHWQDTSDIKILGTPIFPFGN